MEKRVISLREWLGIKRRAVKETEDRGSSILLTWAPALRVMNELDCPTWNLHGADPKNKEWSFPQHWGQVDLGLNFVSAT